MPKEIWFDCDCCRGLGVIEDWDPEWETTYLDDCPCCDGQGGWYVEVEDLSDDN